MGDGLKSVDPALASADGVDGLKYNQIYLPRAEPRALFSLNFRLNGEAS